MSNAKNSRAEDAERISASTSRMRVHSDAGATAITCDSTSHCCIRGSNAAATNSCSSNHLAQHGNANTLLHVVSASNYAANAANASLRIAQAIDPATLHEHFRQATVALGAEQALFITFVRDDANVSTCRFMLACDPEWCRKYLESGLVAHDPWLAYAARRSETVLARSLPVTSIVQQDAVNLAARYGFASAVLVPAHSGAGHSRVGLLCLGSSRPGFFEDDGFAPLRIAARMVSFELHDWWVAKVRRELVLKARVNESDLMLLRREHQGHSSKRIAADLQVSESSINSRFQRMNAKLGVANRRLAAQLAIECGLITT